MNAELLKSKLLEAAFNGSLIHADTSKWEFVSLGDICKYGKCENVRVRDISPNAWILELEDIEKDSAKIIQKLTLSERKISGTRHKFSKGQLLYSKLRTYLNKVLIAPEDGYCTSEILPITFRDGVSPIYMCHFLRSPKVVQYTSLCGQGVKMPRLTPERAKALIVPLPSFAEQQRIVGALEEGFAYIEAVASAKQNLSAAAGLLRSKILQAAFDGSLSNTTDDWKWLKGYDFFLPMESTSLKGKTFKYIDIDAIDNKNCRIREVKIIPTSQRPSRASRKTEKGDVLFSMVRPYLRNIAMVTETDCIASTGFFVCRPSKLLDSKYCYYLMTSDMVVNELNFLMTGDNSPSIRKDDILNHVYPIPPLAEQQRIVAKIEELFTQIDKITK